MRASPKSLLAVLAQFRCLVNRVNEDVGVKEHGLLLDRVAVKAVGFRRAIQRGVEFLAV